MNFPASMPGTFFGSFIAESRMGKTSEEKEYHLRTHFLISSNNIILYTKKTVFIKHFMIKTLHYLEGTAL